MYPVFLNFPRHKRARASPFGHHTLITQYNARFHARVLLRPD